MFLKGINTQLIKEVKTFENDRIAIPWWGQQHPAFSNVFIQDMNHGRKEDGEGQDRAWKHKYQICCIDSDGQHHIQQDPEGIIITADVSEKYYTYDLLNGNKQKARRTKFSNDLDQTTATGPVISCSNNQV